jgi:hypothetical protein
MRKFSTVWDEHDALGQRTGKRRLHDQPGRGLVLDGHERALGQSTGGNRGVFGTQLDKLIHGISLLLRFGPGRMTRAGRAIRRTTF